jgi:predicted dehydrogenase
MPQEMSVLIIGVGSIGLRHLRCFQQTGRVRLSICEIDPALRSRVAQENQIDRQYPNLDAALADRHDAAVIATPAHLHVPAAIRLAEAGLHLFIEKPLGTSMEGVDALKQAIDSRGLAAAVGYVSRANPVLQATKEAIASGRFGRPVEVIAASGQNFPTYRPGYRQTYYQDRATGGGAIQDALTYTFNTAQWFVGPMDRLVVDAAHQILEDVTVEDTVHVLARHGRVLACYSLNQHQAPNESTITVVCECGTVRSETHRNRWRWMARPDEPWHDEPVTPLSRDELFIRQANAFLDAIEGRAQPLCTHDEGIQTLRVNLAALASLDKQTWQMVCPD